jgi:hypothetical protein
VGLNEAGTQAFMAMKFWLEFALPLLGKRGRVFVLTTTPPPPGPFSAFVKSVQVMIYWVFAVAHTISRFQFTGEECEGGFLFPAREPQSGVHVVFGCAARARVCAPAGECAAVESGADDLQDGERGA